MADISRRLSKNVPGIYYVDEECINCGSCVEIAPENFDADDESAFVKKQPENEEEREKCEEAMEACPVEAIGDDGEED